MQQTEAKSSSNTREKLLEAAIDIFGSYGYESATTRMIAGEAGVNIAAIPYYFDGKEGLYRAVISHIVELEQQELSGILENISTMSFEGEDGRGLALSMLESLLEKIINFILGTWQGQRIARIILREQMYPSNAYDLIYSGFMAPILNNMAKLVSAVTGESSEHQAKLRALAIIGQIIAFRVARETIVRSLDLEGYSSEEIQQIREIIIGHTRAALQ